MNEAKPDPDDDFAKFKQEAAKWFEEFKNRTIYTELNSEIIKDIPDAKLPQAIIDFIGASSVRHERGHGAEVLRDFTRRR